MNAKHPAPGGHSPGGALAAFRRTYYETRHLPEIVIGALNRKVRSESIADADVERLLAFVNPGDGMRVHGLVIPGPCRRNHGRFLQSHQSPRSDRRSH
jgi:hypothetical protein